MEPGALYCINGVEWLILENGFAANTVTGEVEINPSFNEQYRKYRFDTVTLTNTQLVRALRRELGLSDETDLQISVTVPGGGDWSGMELDLLEYPIDVSYEH